MKTKIIITAILLMDFTSDDVLTQFNISAVAANNHMFRTISTDYVQFDKSLVDKARSMPVELRVSGTRLLVGLLKEYTESETFKNSYKKYRAEHLAGKAHGFRLPKPSDLLNNAASKMLKSGSSASALPADPSVLVRTRLKEFLEESATVDFDAKLNGHAFADPIYESKDQKWKMYYRAGKPVIEAAREEVKKWLDEVGN